MIGSGVDFDSNPINITFDVGEVNKRVNVPLINDTVVEGEETFDINLSLQSENSQVTIGRKRSIARIIDTTCKLYVVCV